MVATCRLRAAQELLEVARFFQSSLHQTWKAPAKPQVKSQLWVALTSDRGLCGGVNSSICRAIRDNIYEEEKNKELESRGILCYGEKGRSGLNTLFGHLFRGSFSEVDTKSTLYQCGELADAWVAQNANRSLVYYQRFKSMISYETTKDVFYSYDTIKESAQMDYSEFDMEGPADVMRNLGEFLCAVKLYHYLSETNASTLSARMQAMSSSSDNAVDMIDTLTLLLNRTRQAKITTELSEIVSGAQGVEEAEAGQEEETFFVDPEGDTPKEQEENERVLVVERAKKQLEDE